MLADETGHLAGPQEHDTGNDGNLEGLHFSHEALELVQVEHRRGQKIAGAVGEHGLDRPHFLVRCVLSLRGIHTRTQTERNRVADVLAFDVPAVLERFHDREELGRVHVEEHLLFLGNAGQGVVLVEDQNIVEPELVGLDQVRLQVGTVFAPGGGLVDGVELLFLEGPPHAEGIHGLRGLFEFRDGQAVHAAPDAVDILEELVHLLVNRRLDLDGHYKRLLVQLFLECHESASSDSCRGRGSMPALGAGFVSRLPGSSVAVGDLLVLVRIQQAGDLLSQPFQRKGL